MEIFLNPYGEKDSSGEIFEGCEKEDSSGESFNGLNDYGQEFIIDYGQEFIIDYGQEIGKPSRLQPDSVRRIDFPLNDYGEEIIIGKPRRLQPDGVRRIDFPPNDYGEEIIIGKSVRLQPPDAYYNKGNSPTNLGRDIDPGSTLVKL